MSKLPDPTQNLSVEGQKIYDEICSVRENHWAGLFPMLMLYPELAQRFSQLSGLLRFDGILPSKYREFCILTVGAKTKTAYIFETHLEPAKEARLPDEIIQKILQDTENYDKVDPFYTKITQLVDILLNLQVMPQKLQDSLTEQFGYESYLQLNVLVGMYRMIASFVKAYEFPLPPGMKDPFL